jgi:hypothetical protein
VTIVVPAVKPVIIPLLEPIVALLLLVLQRPPPASVIVMVLEVHAADGPVIEEGNVFTVIVAVT